MTATIQKVGVLGSGVMGAGIAAHVANAGLPVVLLDIAPSRAVRRLTTPARGALISVRASLTVISLPCAWAKARSALAIARACRAELARACPDRAAAAR